MSAEIEHAGRYASVVIGAAFTVGDARAQRAAFRDAAERAGRNPGEVRFIPGMMTTIAADKRAALDRHRLPAQKTMEAEILHEAVSQAAGPKKIATALHLVARRPDQSGEA